MFMKIAMLAPIAWSTPPKKYGPWEQVASTLTEALVKVGHEVTLFATADSRTSGKLEAVCPLPYAENPDMDPKVWECLHISHLMEQAADFDIIHNHFDFLPLSYSRLINTPMITTIHGFSSPRILPVYKKYNSDTAYISISNADRHPDLDYLDTIYHGIDSKDFKFREKKEDYLLYFGRIHPDKGAHEAIAIAKKSGHPLKIAGLIQDQEYFERQVEPHIDDQNIIYLGNADPEMRSELLAGAKALLHPIFFEEPFGLSIAEALMSGTPVIAYYRGSMPELIQHGVTGFLVNDLESAMAAVDQLGQLNPQDCRHYAESHFSVEVMAARYLEAYKVVVDGRV